MQRVAASILPRIDASRLRPWQLSAVRCFAALQYPAPKQGVTWKDFGFSLTTRDTQMVISTCSSGQKWSDCSLQPYGALALEPAATILNYGQGIFEGVKAFRTAKDRIVLFRPQKNALRLADGARRLLMPPVPQQMFMEACSMAVRANAEWVPPCGEGALYLRPLLFGSGSDLGVKPSSQYTLVVYVAPVGQYFGPGSTGARMKIHREQQRAAPSGVGHVKAVGNYAQCFSAQRDAKADGFSDIIYLDVAGEYIDEAAASNFFCVSKDRIVYTPQLGSILPGVTRESILQLVRSVADQENLQLQVGRISASTAMNCVEAFLTGTGAGITPVQHLADGDKSINLASPGPVTQMMQKMLSDIQQEKTRDEFRWLHDPFAEGNISLDSYVEPAF